MQNQFKFWSLMRSFTLFLIFISVIIYYYNMLEIIQVRAMSNLDVGIDSISQPIGDNYVQTIGPGDNIYVLQCKDIKSDVVILVEANGKRGYISNGNFTLIRKKVTFRSIMSEYNYVTCSCQGMFEKRSEYQ